MKVSELSGAMLDLAVARHDPMCSMLTWENRGDHWVGVANIEGTPTVCCFIRESNVLRMLGLKMLYDAPEYSPSRNWSDGGPIIEQEDMNIGPSVHVPLYFASAYDGSNEMEGRTMLEAAMRCFVASKFGEEVPDADLI